MFESNGNVLCISFKKETSSFSFVCIIRISDLKLLTYDHKQPTRKVMKTVTIKHIL